MKTSKPALQTSAHEECGVWLDTVQLKEKAKQKRLARPISKLLNPFAEGGGYNLAVALNFTQTKMEMPKTKQTSISTFFTSHRRVLNKMSTSEVPKMDLVQSSLYTSTAPTLVTAGTKRRRETDLEKSDMCKPEPGVDLECRSETVTVPEAAVGQEHDEADPTPSPYMHFKCEEVQCDVFNPPQSIRRLTDSYSLAGDSQRLPQAWSQDPLLISSQYSDSEFYLTNQKNTTAKNLNNSETSFLNSLQSDNAFGFQLDLEGRTSTQKSFKLFYSSQMDDEKENSRALPFNSPRKHSSFSHLGPLSNPKWTEPKTTSPQKHITNQQWKMADEEESCNSLFKYSKPRSSPFKKQAKEQQNREVDEDNLAMLFTQDSEGFRVIAHRGLQTRSPFKDQTNVSSGTVKISAYKSLQEEDEEDEMLFTQDSQGNMVIKH